jgi:hypothetical protein
MATSAQLAPAGPWLVCILHDQACCLVHVMASSGAPRAMSGSRRDDLGNRADLKGNSAPSCNGLPGASSTQVNGLPFHPSALLA